MKGKDAYKMMGFREDYDPDKRIIGSDTVELNGIKYYVSTVDLGLNHRFGEGKPLYWETMIFKKDENGSINYCDLYCDRYSSKEDAEKYHKEIIQAFNEGRVKRNEYGFEIEGFTEREDY